MTEDYKPNAGEHPITPPPELVEDWSRFAYTIPGVDSCGMAKYIATQAARWGADQELEACCEWLISHGWFGSSNHDAIRGLRAARRPKPPSLKERALEAVESGLMTDARLDTIRRALEQLPDAL